MSRCDIRIDLDRDQREYRGGDTVKGTVIVRANEDLQCKGLTIELAWRTHGRGDRNTQTIDSRLEPAQEWRQGAESHYPFSFKLAASPWTYRGHLLNIDYYVRACAEFSWAKDARAEEEIIVFPGEMPPQGMSPDATEEEALQDDLAALKAFRKIFSTNLKQSIVVVLILLALSYLFTPLVLVLVLFAFIKPIRALLAERKLGEVQVELDPRKASPGDALSLRVWGTATERISFNGATATLLAKEICASGSGTDRSAAEHTIHKAAIPLAPASPYEFRGELFIPETDAYTFGSQDNEIVWQVSIYLDVSNWPDWQRVYPLTVVPRSPEPQEGR